MNDRPDDDAASEAQADRAWEAQADRACEAQADRACEAQADRACEAQADRAWDLLDLLPRGAPHPSLAATTIEMAAIATHDASPRPDAAGERVARWGVAAVIVAASFVAGIAAGEARRPSIDPPPVGPARVRGDLPGPWRPLPPRPRRGDARLPPRGEVERPVGPPDAPDNQRGKAARAD